MGKEVCLKKGCHKEMWCGGRGVKGIVRLILRVCGIVG